MYSVVTSYINQKCWLFPKVSVTFTEKCFFSNSKLSYFETSLAIQNKDIFEQKRWLSSKRIREYKAPPCCSRASFYLQVSFSEV